MTTYRPFLKTTRSELDAARSIKGIGTTIQPVWELIPPSSGLPVTTLVGRLCELADRVAWRIDARHIAQATISVLDAECRSGGVGYIPVIGPASKPADLAAAAVAVAHHRCGLTVRVSAPAGSTGPTNVDQAAAMVRSLGVRPGQADLIIDCGFIADAHTASLTAGRLLVPIHRALTRRWRSLTVLSGAFPSAPSPVSVDAPMIVPRHDAAMFRQLPYAVDFGDFGVAHALASPAEDDAPPSLRWNRGDDWVVYGHAAIGSVQLPSTRRFTSGFAMPNSTSAWAEWSTSHHLATVRQRLDRNQA